MTVKAYASAAAFLQGLTERLRSIAAEEEMPISEIRRQIAFERLLARLFHTRPAPWILKGGFALELRLNNARATKDIDLALRGTRLDTVEELEQGEALHEALVKALRTDLGDFFSFTVSRPIHDLDAAPYGGARFRVNAEVAGKSFARFMLDVGVGDAVLEPLDELEPKNWLAFAGIESNCFLSLCAEQHFAEKIHAYTLPRPEGRSNSRVKDLVDLALLVETGDLDQECVQKALQKTFLRRKTHDIPEQLPEPPAGWDQPFSAMAGTLGLSHDLQSALSVVRRYYERLIIG